MSIFSNKTITCQMTRWCGWLRQCATNRKAAVSIPDYAIEIVHYHKPSTAL